MNRFPLYRQFQQLGRELFLAGLNNSHSGNMSCRLDTRELWITRTGAMLGNLQLNDLVSVHLQGNDPREKQASVELPLHRAVYQLTAHQAIVHAHPPALIALSLRNQRIVPIDEEGKYYNPEGIPVVCARESIGSLESAALVAHSLQKETAVVLRGHGMFAAAANLEAAAKLISSAEHSARILIHFINASREEMPS